MDEKTRSEDMQADLNQNGMSLLRIVQGAISTDIDVMVLARLLVMLLVIL